MQSKQRRSLMPLEIKRQLSFRCSQGKLLIKPFVRKSLLLNLFSASHLISDGINLLRQLFHDRIIHQLGTLVFSNPFVNI